MDNYNGTSSDECRISETWKALDLYGIAVSDKGRIMVNGEIIEPSPPYKSSKRWHFKFINPLTGDIVKRDAAIMVWRTFKSKVGRNIKITFKDGDMSNVNLENLQWEYIRPPKKIQHIERIKQSQLTIEQMKARVPKVIEQMVMMWGKEEEKTELLKGVKSG